MYFFNLDWQINLQFVLDSANSNLVILNSLLFWTQAISLE